MGPGKQWMANVRIFSVYIVRGARFANGKLASLFCCCQSHWTFLLVNAYSFRVRGTITEKIAWPLHDVIRMRFAARATPPWRKVFGRRPLPIAAALH